MQTALAPMRSDALLARALGLAAAGALAMGLLSAVAVAEAADSNGKFRVFGSGQVSCDRWLQDRRDGNPSGAQSEMWMAGYLTAYNQFVHKDFDVAQRFVGGNMMEWVDDYCRKRPRNTLVIAARELVLMLRRQR